MDTIKISPCSRFASDPDEKCQGAGQWLWDSYTGDYYIAADPSITADLCGGMAVYQIGTPGMVLTASDLVTPGTSICAHWMADLEALAAAANDAVA